MKKILEKAKDDFLKTIKDKNLYIFFFISLLFFGIFCAEQKALDTYDVFSYDPSRITGHFASCGRFVTAGANAIDMAIVTAHKLIRFFLYIISPP